MDTTAINKDIAALQHDLKSMLARVEYHKKDAERGIYVNMEPTAHGVSAEDKVESLTHYLINAKHDFDWIKDDLKIIMEHLENLQDAIEYEALASSIR